MQLSLASFVAPSRPDVAVVPSRCTDNNAFWDTEKNTITYGDGDGSEYSFFSLGLDVVAHEVRSWVPRSCQFVFYELTQFARFMLARARGHMVRIQTDV
jgi:Thermolysin metallopeptidase, catalytic domain